MDARGAGCSAVATAAEGIASVALAEAAPVAQAQAGPAEALSPGSAVVHPAEEDGGDARGLTAPGPSGAEGVPPSGAQGEVAAASQGTDFSGGGGGGGDASAGAPQAAVHRMTKKQQGKAQREQHQLKQQQEKQQQQQQDAGKARLKPKTVAVHDPSSLDELLDLATLYDGNEEELVARLMAQLQGLSYKQQQLYGIWDEAGGPEAGRRAFVERWRQRHAERRAMVAAVSDPATDPRDRMAARTEYILRWRKILYSCPRCWLLPGLCVCGRMARFSPARTRLVVHAHHGEWGSASNSGCLLPTSLEGAEMLLYSHPDHDRRLREILADPTTTTALLWPGADSLLPQELAALAEKRTGGSLTVIALDATWPNARRMHGWFPKETLTVRLPPESTLKENKLSLLRPVRAYGGDLDSGRVSTLEAVAHLLYELEGDEATYRGLLDNLKIKVDACRLQKNRSLVYGTQEAAKPGPAARRRGAAAAAAAAASGGGAGGAEDAEAGAAGGASEAAAAAEAVVGAGLVQAAGGGGEAGLAGVS